MDLPGGGRRNERVFHVNPDVRQRLERYEELLRKWQKIKNLVAPATLDEIWERHFADCLQITDLLPEGPVVADLGSGAGFPGLVIAAALKDDPNAHIHLIEANGRKCSFLSSVSREIKLPVTVHNFRIESDVQQLSGRIGFVTARALAPLPKLLDYAEPLLASGAVGLFHKGREYLSEIDNASQNWAFDLLKHDSRTDDEGCILEIRNVSRKSL